MTSKFSKPDSNGKTNRSSDSNGKTNRPADKEDKNNLKDNPKKFMSDNEYHRNDETTSQAIKRKNEIEDQLKKDLMDKNNKKLKQLFGDADPITYPYKSNANSSMVKTEMQTISSKSNIICAKIGNSKFFFTLSDQEDETMISLITELGASELKVVYKQVILDDDPSTLFIDYKKTLDDCISSINRVLYTSNCYNYTIYQALISSYLSIYRFIL